MSESKSGRSGRPRIVLTVAALACALAGSLSRAEENPVETFLQTDFEQGLTGWTTQGDAEITLAPARGRSGRCSATIRVAPGANLAYPQHIFDITEGFAAGDTFDASVWVRAQDVDQDPGAYFVLEYRDGDQRLSITHSATGAANGARDWQQLAIYGAQVPAGATCLRISLILHAHGQAWFDDLSVRRTGQAPRAFAGGKRTVTVNPATVVHSRFGGVGFHVFYPCHEASKELLDTVIVKRWREMNPSFARVTHDWSWDDARLSYVAEQMALWQETGAEVYLTTWNPPECPTDDERRAYAVRVADMLEFFVKQHRLDNLKTYCLTNELSLNGWGKLLQDLPTFRAYHQAFFEEFKRRDLPVQLLATDASPIGNWGSIEWATTAMDDISGVYGGHHYINNYPLEDTNFYPWFLDRLTWGAGMARSKDKDFIIGEFGCKQDGQVRNGKRNDACIYWDTDKEALVGIQLGEAAIASLNAGIYALGSWTFADFPDEYSPTYQNKWGTFKWSGSDMSTRPHYYAYALLTRALRGPATVVNVESNDPLVRAAALQHHATRTWSVVLINRNPQAVEIELSLPSTGPLRRYVYDPTAPPFSPFGDLPGPNEILQPGQNPLAQVVPANALVVLTDLFSEDVPDAVTGLQHRGVDEGVRLNWTAPAADDICYYRVYRTQNGQRLQIGSTVATAFVDRQGIATATYAVTAVNQAGNEGPWH